MTGWGARRQESQGHQDSMLESELSPILEAVDGGDLGVGDLGCPEAPSKT